MFAHIRLLAQVVTALTAQVAAAGEERGRLLSHIERLDSDLHRTAEERDRYIVFVLRSRTLCSYNLRHSLQAELPPHGVIAGLLRDVYDHMQRGTVLSGVPRSTGLAPAAVTVAEYGVIKPRPPVAVAAAGAAAAVLLRGGGGGVSKSVASAAIESRGDKENVQVGEYGVLPSARTTKD